MANLRRIELSQWLHWYSAVALIIATVLGACPQNALAQSGENAGVEGRVFDRATGRPVRGVLVVLRESIFQFPFPIPQRDTTLITDANGFFQFEMQQLPGTYPSLVARCETPRGDVESTLPLYSPLRAGEVYSRTFYISLPRKYTSCYPR